MIYDCFTFFNELDLLEIRLNVLNSVVDKFVLVEATHTFQGNPKPLYFSEHRDRYKAFQDKIVHVVVDDLPTHPWYLKWKKSDAWAMETYQRNAIARGLKNCKMDDTIVVSDLDEIPDPQQVKMFQGEPGINIFHQKNYYYYLNCLAVDEEWYGSVMTRYSNFIKPQSLRVVSKEMQAKKKRILKDPIYRFIRSIIHPVLRKKINVLKDAGWQFGYLGGADKIIQKIEAFSHTEYNSEVFKNREAVLQNMERGLDLFGRETSYSFVELDDSFPPYILENKDRLKHLIKSRK